jgi:hypothetical protein
MGFETGDRVEVRTGASGDPLDPCPPLVRGTVSANRPPESGSPRNDGWHAWIEFDVPVYSLKAAWVHIEDCRKLGLLELIAEAAQ